MSSVDTASPSLPDWPRAHGAPPCVAVLRSQPEDFRVDEVLGFGADGEGEHLLLQVRKRNRNTDQVARSLARHAGIKARDVSYCGLKDRVAVTTQWFSLWLPGRPDPDWTGLVDDDLQILAQARHRRKLPRGALQANHFRLVLRELQGDRDAVEQRLAHIGAQGVPNYFGEQRFGRDGGNVDAACAMFAGRRVKDRHQRGLYLSAARSFLFNQVLARRVREANWNQILPGEALMLAGSRSFFVADEVDDTLAARLAAGDISPSGPLWGKGELPAQAEAAGLEQHVVADYPELCQGLIAAGLKQERRALRLVVEGLHWQWPDPHSLQLDFSLPAGSYATAVLRELMTPA